MDLKVVCLLFGCLLSIALGQGEEESEDRGSRDRGSEDRGSEEGRCRCEGRDRGGPGWGGHGGKRQRDGRGRGKRCHPMSLGIFDECKLFSERLCEGKCRFKIISFYTKFYVWLCVYCNG